MSCVLADDRSLSGLLSSCSSGQLTLQGHLSGQAHTQLPRQGQGQLPGQSHGQKALEGFQQLDFSAQIALLQRLTAARVDVSDSKLLQASCPQACISTAASLYQPLR